MLKTNLRVALNSVRQLGGNWDISQIKVIKSKISLQNWNAHSMTGFVVFLFVCFFFFFSFPAFFFLLLVKDPFHQQAFFL